MQSSGYVFSFWLKMEKAQNSHRNLYAEVTVKHAFIVPKLSDYPVSGA
jgi:hypothetical protein